MINNLHIDLNVVLRFSSSLKLLSNALLRQPCMPWSCPPSSWPIMVVGLVAWWLRTSLPKFNTTSVSLGGWQMVGPSLIWPSPQRRLFVLKSSAYCRSPQDEKVSHMSLLEPIEIDQANTCARFASICAPQTGG